MGILVPRRLPSDAAARIDLNDMMVLGEICYCAPHRNGFVIGIKLHHTLTNLSGFLGNFSNKVGD